MLLDSIRITAPDLDEATRAYTLLLGIPPTVEGNGVRRFQLGRGAIELTAGPGGIDSLGFLVADGTPVPQLGADVALRIARGTPPPHDDTMAVAIDHVVIQSPDAARATALWHDGAGLRLALDREFPARGLRLLFFRTNGITLEYATPLPAPTADATPDRLWGVSYRVRDLTARRERLVAAGVDVSEVRTGMKPGTTVATVRSGTAGIPTILIQPDTQH